MQDKLSTLDARVVCRDTRLYRYFIGIGPDRTWFRIPKNHGSRIDIPVLDGKLAAIVGRVGSKIGVIKK